MVDSTTKQENKKKQSNTLLIVSILIIIGGGVFVVTQAMQLVIIDNVANMCKEAAVLGDLISEKNQLACYYISQETQHRQVLFSFAIGILIFGVILITFAIYKKKQ